MARFAMLIEYDGGPYSGWQRQDNAPSVQEAIEKALICLGENDPLVYGAGRTDAGVHATGQVAHVDLVRDWPAQQLQEAVNSQLRPQPVALLGVEEMPDEFHARFSATGRHYLYRIINRRPHLAIEAGKAWHVKKPLDDKAMHAAAQLLLGTHDFTTYRSARCQSKSPLKTLDRLDVSRHGDVIEIRAGARSFLHNQVRSLAGALKSVGSGHWQPDDVVRALEARDRRACAAVAPPGGLYLTGVDYPFRIF
ncbi:MAG TPA: tRNA pseudouridine(38-40) synthase TruA [Rhizobiales bacterium]|nr:tRNA pseudouridine(38-40) synthase TruA [Hyphomicrobiales bacterium]